MRVLLLSFLFASIGAQPTGAADTPVALPFSVGETIQYDIKRFNLKWGETTITFHGLVALEGQAVFLMTVASKGLKFFDEEQIYFDPETFFPIRVERDLNIFGKKEKITEYYDAEQKTLKIIKMAKGQTIEQAIARPHALDNLYCFIFRYRRTGKFEAGERIMIHLPTRDVQLELGDVQILRLGGRKIPTYFMRSDPPQYRVWFAADNRRMPVRIDGAVGVTKAAMIIKK